MLYGKRRTSVVVFIVAIAFMTLAMIPGCNGDTVDVDATDETETNGIEEAAEEKPQEPRGNTPGNINQEGFVAASDGWVYFTMPDDGRLIKMRQDGTEMQVLLDEGSGGQKNIQYINVIDDWIYFTSSSNIIKVRTDGSERTVVESIAGAMHMNVVGGWIYYAAALGGGVYEITTDGENKAKIHDARAFAVNVFDDWVYFVNRDDDWRPYKAKIDGTESARLSGIDISNLQYHEGILYSTDGITVSYVSVDGGMRSELDHAQAISDFIIDDGLIYYLFPTGISMESYNLTRLDPDSGEEEIIQEVKMFDDSEKRTVISNFNIAEDWVYMYAKLIDTDHESISDWETVDEALFRIQTDGSGLVRVIDPETEIESIAREKEEGELTGSGDYLVDVPALIGLDFDDAVAVLDQYFSDPPTVEGPKEYMGAEITIYAYVDLIEDSLMAFGVGLGKVEGIENVDDSPLYVMMGTIEGIPMDYDLEDLYRFTNVDPSADGYFLEDIEVSDNLIEFTVQPNQ